MRLETTSNNSLLFSLPLLMRVCFSLLPVPPPSHSQRGLCPAARHGASQPTPYGLAALMFPMALAYSVLLLPTALAQHPKHLLHLWAGQQWSLLSEVRRLMQTHLCFCKRAVGTWLCPEPRVSLTGGFWQGYGALLSGSWEPVDLFGALLVSTHLQCPKKRKGALRAKEGWGSTL